MPEPALPAPDNDLEPDEEKSDRTRDAGRRLFEDAFGRLLVKEARHVERLLKKRGDGPALAAAIGEFYDKHLETARGTLLPVVEAYADLRGQDRCALDEVVLSHIGQSRGQLLGIIRDNDNGNLRAAIQNRLDQWLESRAAKAADEWSV